MERMKERFCPGSICGCSHGNLWLRGHMLGKGSHAEVYKATLIKSRAKYSCFPSVMAVKSAEVSDSASLQKERQVLLYFQGCSNIIQCLGEETTSRVEGEMVYNLLLEYASKGTLADVIKKTNGVGLPESVVKGLTKSIVKGILDVHELGFVHCDLKPANVFLKKRSGGRVVAKIGDFGSAKRVAKGDSQKRKLDSYLRGTALYIPPEAWTKKVQEPSGDIWALGCTVLEMLTGKPAWGADLDNGVGGLRKKTKMYRHKMPDFPDGISVECREFLKGCFAKKALSRLTAKMLLNHAFLEGVDESPVQLPEDEKTGKVSPLGSVAETKNKHCPLSSDGESSASSDSDSYFSENSDDEEGTGFGSLGVNQEDIGGNMGNKGLASPPTSVVQASVG